MGQVLKFARKSRAAAPRAGSPGPLEARAWFCTRCEGDRFLLYPGGSVQCAGCGVRLDNLRVEENSSGGSGVRR